MPADPAHKCLPAIRGRFCFHCHYNQLNWVFRKVRSWKCGTILTDQTPPRSWQGSSLQAKLWELRTDWKNRLEVLSVHQNPWADSLEGLHPPKLYKYKYSFRNWERTHSGSIRKIIGYITDLQEIYRCLLQESYQIHTLHTYIHTNIHTHTYIHKYISIHYIHI
jgi:hypothetical protein